MTNLRVASMFAGIGGICSGFVQVGCKIVWANELNAASCRTYAYNFGPDYLVEGDIRKIKPDSIPEFDILTAGFPCQSFSIGGSQKGFEDNRGTLFFEVARIIGTKLPRFVFLENVENLLEHDGGRTFLVIYNILAQYGYAVRYKVMPTNEYGGLPQARKRIYIVAFRDARCCDAFRFPEPIACERTIADIVNVTQRKNGVYYIDQSSNLYTQLDRFIDGKSGLFRVYNGQVRDLRNPTVCPTLTASMNSVNNAIVLRDAYGTRRLTLRESLDFQGFSEGFCFPNMVTLTEAYTQIGNSVSVPVVKRIAERISLLYDNIERK